MSQDRIKYLLEKYYSGEISPDDYEALLSLLKEAKDLTPELEAERMVLFSIESCEPLMPDEFEKRLNEAIDKRYRRANYIKMIFWGGAAAAVILICVLVGTINNGNKNLTDSDYMASTSIGYEEMESIATSSTDTTMEAAITADSEEAVITGKKASPEIEEESVIAEINDEELDDAVRTVDSALLNILSNIHIAQNNVVESFENIEIDRNININI